MKRTTLLAGFVCLMLHTAIAQNEELTPKDPKAKAILEELSKKTRSYSSIKAEFSYTMENKDEGIHETQNGSLLLKSSKYRLEIAGQQVISDGKTVWTHLKDANEVHINNVPPAEEQADNLMNPANLFTLYEKGFKYVYDKEESRDGRVLQLIKLFPVSANEKAYHTILLSVDKAKMELYSVRVFSKDGNIFTYKLTRFIPNAEAGDALFQFDVSKAGDVIDLRE